MIPRSGDVLHVTRAASVQFVNPIYFRMIRVHDWPTYRGWIWLDGYELNAAREAVARRSIFVQLSGLKQVYSAPRSMVLSGPGALPAAGRGTGRVRIG